MNASELTELAARVESGSGRDYELETLIAEALGWRDTIVADTFPFRWTKPDGSTCKEAPQWTSSLDAVVALIAERLPGMRWWMDQMPDGSWEVCSRTTELAAGRTLCRAWLVAALRALAAQQQDRQTEGE